MIRFNKEKHVGAIVSGLTREHAPPVDGHQALVLAADGGRGRHILDALPQMIWTLRPDTGETFYNAQCVAFTGVDLGACDSAGRMELVHPEDRQGAIDTWADCSATGRLFEREYRVRHHSGEYRWVLSRARARRNRQGRIIRWYGAVTDIHDRKLAELASARSESLHRSVLQASVDCIKLIDLDGRIELINTPGLHAMEIDEPEFFLGKDWASLWPAESRPIVLEAMELAKTGQPARFSSACQTARGTQKWWDVIVSPLKDEAGCVQQLLAISRDVSVLRTTAEQLRWASEHDALTDLPNRRAFQMRLEAAVIRAMRSGATVGLFILDLDYFKNVNDNLGHAAGDHLLRVVAGRLREQLRDTDYVARLGGDEFAVLLEEIEDEESFEVTAKSILAGLQLPTRFDGRLITGAASIGGALFPRDSGNANDLLRNADAALCAIKVEERGGVKIFHQQVRQHAQACSSQLSLARIAVQEGTILPFYQPKVLLPSGGICGFEALLRWEHPRRGIQLPQTICEAFKDHDLASKIGEIIQGAVIADVRRWASAGVAFGHVSINAAPSEFLRDDYAERLLARLREGAVDPSRVEIEVTEHVFLGRGRDYVGRALRKLSQAGVRVSLDDFGTGYSSLSHLKDFPVDALKIDRSFVENMDDCSEAAAIVTALIDLARNLSIDVVAEGIETERQKQLLDARGCPMGQGFLFGEAAPADCVPHLTRLLVKAGRAFQAADPVVARIRPPALPRPSRSGPNHAIAC
jgi:diguanylate cyclase (GGDEF)-like protein/PAS domain S-box-containing protein